MASSELLLVSRVILGLIYRKLIDNNDAITTEAAASLTGRLLNKPNLTPFELNKICSFEDQEYFYHGDQVQLQDDLINFLSIYKDLSLYNYDQWVGINIQIEKFLKEEQVKAKAKNEKFQKQWGKAQRKRKLKRYIILSIPALIGIGILTVDYFFWNKYVSPASGSEAGSNILMLNVIGGISITRTYYKLWRQKKRMR